MNIDKYINNIDTRFACNKYILPSEYKGLQLFKQIGDKLLGGVNKYIIDEYNEEFITQLLSWFFNRKTFNGDLSKGLFIRANVGRGKSLALMIMFHFAKWYRSNNINYNKVFNYREMLYEQNLAKFDKLYIPDIYTYNSRATKLMNLYNDVGREGIIYDISKPITSDDKIINRFGDKLNIFANLFEQEYLRFQNTGMPCIIITNHEPEKYKTWYGAEIYSRLNEMFNFLELGGFDRRK